MSLELLNTAGTLLTVAIVSATAIAALVQLRHLRAGNQITAMISIGENLGGTAFRDALSLVGLRLATTLDDPAFREYSAALTRGLTPSEVYPEYAEVRSAALLVGNAYEELGILVKNGIVDKTMFLDRYTFVIIRTWNQLEAFNAFNRAVAGDSSLWENFELLTVYSQDWDREHPSDYPKGVRRLQLTSPWPVPPAPQPAPA
jgi:hypothetical protein